MVGVLADAKAQRHDIGMVNLGGFGDIAQWRFHTHGQAVAALRSQEALGHEQTHCMFFLRKGGEQHAGLAVQGMAAELVDGLAQHAGSALGVHMLFKHLDFRAHPRVTHHRVQRREQFDNETVDPQAGHGLVQMAAQTINILRAKQAHGLAEQLSHTVFAMR